MAGDLIPPPSPAGRPEPDSTEKLARRPEPEGGGLWAGGEEEGATFRPAVALAAADPAAASDEALREAEAVAATPAVRSPYRSRFGFVLGGLIGVALVAVGLGLAWTLGSSEDGVSDGWSAWKPTAEDKLGAAKQIADHVGSKYRLGDGEQLVAVQSGDLEVNSLPVEGVAMRTAAAGGDIELLEGKPVMYTLNGLGPNGSIASGIPSNERHLLVRREALELALYTFRYRDDVDMVVTLLPPNKDDVAAAAREEKPVELQALFYRPGDLEGELNVPLVSTISAQTPRPETLELTSREGQRIDALTSTNLFTAAFQQGQNATLFLVLDRPPTG